MTQLIKRFFIFSAILFLITIVLDVLLSNQSKYIISTDTHILNEIYEHKIDDPCLIYGSSRASVHINPFIIEERTGISAYNLGTPGQVFAGEKIRHQIYLENNNPPKYIIYSLDAFMLIDMVYFVNGDQFLPYMFWNMNLKSMIGKYYDIPDFYIPLKRYYGKSYITTKSILHSLNIKTKKPLTKGFNAVDLEWVEDIDIPQIKDDAQRVDISSNALFEFESLIDECKDLEIKLALVYTPEYYLASTYMTNRDSIVDLYRDLAQKHNTPFINFAHDSICYDRSYFYNAMHLNKRGSTLITSMIIDSLQQAKFFDPNM